jgi:hypothetical protein
MAVFQYQSEIIDLATFIETYYRSITYVNRNRWYFNADFIQSTKQSDHPSSSYLDCSAQFNLPSSADPSSSYLDCSAQFNRLSSADSFSASVSLYSVCDASAASKVKLTQTSTRALMAKSSDSSDNLSYLPVYTPITSLSGPSRSKSI